MQEKKAKILILLGIVFVVAIIALFFENKKLSLHIINPETHPHLGKNWTIFFNTTGTADLNIYPLNKQTIDDLEFVFLICKDKKLSPKINNKSELRFDDWACDGLGALAYKVKKSGNHNFKFQFGNKKAFANNSSQTTYDYSASSSVSRMAYEGKDTASSIPVNVASSSWNVAGTQFTTGMYTNINSSNDNYASTTDTSSSTFKQIVHEFYIKINEATTSVIAIDYHWEGLATKNEEIAGDNDLRLYVYDYANSAWRMTSSSLDNACDSSDCTLIHTTTTNLSNFFDRNKGVRFAVQKYEAGSNCSSSPATITCGKKSTATPPTGCVTQTNSEDLWSQCATTDSGGCGTGNCSGGIGICGIYFDSAQHGTCNTQCQGCRSNGSGCGNIDTTAGSNQLGCSGSCAKCTSGSCETSSCEGLQCGCAEYEICVSGTCMANICSTSEMCAGFSYATCVDSVGTCEGAGYTSKGSTFDCTGGTPVCCCVP